MATWPTHEQLETFLAGPADEPVVMLNMLTFKRDADPSHEGMTGREAVLQYSRAMRSFVEAHGGTFVLAANVDSQLIGEGGEQFHFVGIMRYPSRQAYLELAVLVRALEGLSASARFASQPDRASLWAGLFDLRENLFEAVDDLRALAA